MIDDPTISGWITFIFNIDNKYMLRITKILDT